MSTDNCEPPEDRLLRLLSENHIELNVVEGLRLIVAFNKIKGSTPVRTDVDVSSLPPYQQAAAKSYRNDGLVWSIAHGEATSASFQQEEKTKSRKKSWKPIA